MFDIVIVGFGKAGKLHHLFLKEKISPENVVLCYDPFLKNLDVNNASLINKAELEGVNWQKGTILDICTNSDRHIEWIEYAIERNIKHVIIEKPLVTKQVDLNKIRNLKGDKTSLFAVNYNYLLSPIFLRLQDIISDYKLKIIHVKTNFSKDRKEDSLLKRGADSDGTLVHNFLIEIPHQLSIAKRLLGEVQDIILCKSVDMIIGDNVFKDHGKGFIRVSHAGGAISSHFSDLTNKRTIRKLIVEADRNYVLVCHFGYSENQVGSIKIFKDGELKYISSVIDNSLSFFLTETIAFFGKKVGNPCDLDFSIAVNQTILEGINKTSNV